jgi:hypothetical protein
MVIETPDYDLSKLEDRFIEHGTYTKDIILSELLLAQKTEDFLCLISETGFLIGYKNYDSLWISQVYNEPGSSLLESNTALTMAKDFARSRGMTSLTGETNRDEWKALKRKGFKEYSVIIRCEI